jgi:hypothetical protein
MVHMNLLINTLHAQGEDKMSPLTFNRFRQKGQKEVREKAKIDWICMEFALTCKKY